MHLNRLFVLIVLLIKPWLRFVLLVRLCTSYGASVYLQHTQTLVITVQGKFSMIRVSCFNFEFPE